MTFPNFKALTGATLIMAASAVSASAASFTLFTDRASFDAAASNIVTEDFNGAASDFAGDSTGNVIGDQTTLDIIGPGDSIRMGLTGDGFLSLDVVSSGFSPAAYTAYTLNTGPIFGFALDTVQDNSSLSPSFSEEEVGLRFGGESWLISDILGLTDSSTATSNIGSVSSGGAVFVGILSDMAFSSFDIVHGDLVAPFGVSGIAEAMWIDNLVLATAPAAVPVPAGLPLLLAGIGAFGVMRRRR